jgi:hypothetical protein
MDGQYQDPFFSQGDVFVTAIQMMSNGDVVGGDGQVGKGDRDRGQGTGRGDDARNDNRRVEGRLIFYFEREFHAQKLWQRGTLHQKLQRVCWRRALVREDGNRGNAAGKSYVNGITMVLG